MRQSALVAATAMGLAILAEGARAQAQSAPPPDRAAQARPVAVVDGEAITPAELDAALRARGPVPSNLSEAQHRQYRVETLAMLIDDILLQQFLRHKCPRIEPAEIDKRMAVAAEGLKRQGKTLADFCRETGQTEADIRNSQTLMLQWAAHVRPRLTDPELKRYHDDNRDFFDRVLVRASHIVLRLPASSGEAERTAAVQKLQALRQEIASGKIDFAAAAAKQSQCASGPKGGDVGHFPRKFVVDDAFARAAFALPVGQVSDVVATAQGLHLIKVIERSNAEPSEFQKIREQVREVCLEEIRQEVLAQLRRSAKVEICLPQ